LFGCSGSEKVLTPPQPYDQSAAAMRTPQIARPIADVLAYGSIPPNTTPAKPQQMLAVSAGGQYAAYDAGLLVGWTAKGDRPTLDVVTGVSSGAIVATYAFLGSKYDPNLQRFFTTTSDKDLFTFRPVVGLIRDGAIANPAKLIALIERETNDEFLFDLRQAHSEGRRLYIGTMNTRTRRMSFWDLGAIASCGRSDATELVRKVLLAAGAIPGLLPGVTFDVEIDGIKYAEEHSDGGAACQTFLRLGPAGERPAPDARGWLAGSNLYILTAGKLYAPPQEGKLGFLKRLTGSISAALYALYRAEVLNLYAFCAVSGAKYHFIAVPDNAEIPPKSTNFDPVAMQKLFALGFDHGKSGIAWRLTPPGSEPSEEEAPRNRPDTISIPPKR